MVASELDDELSLVVGGRVAFLVALGAPVAEGLGKQLLVQLFTGAGVLEGLGWQFALHFGLGAGVIVGVFEQTTPGPGTQKQLSFSLGGTQDPVKQVQFAPAPFSRGVTSGHKVQRGRPFGI